MIKQQNIKHNNWHHQYDDRHLHDIEIKLKSSRQLGIAYIIVLGFVAFISLASLSVLRSNNLNIDRVSRMQTLIQAQELLNMGREWSSLIIFEDMINGPNQSRDFDNFDDDWAQELASPIVGEGQQIGMEVNIDDAQGRFNLNNLHPDIDEDETWYDAFVLLLREKNIADTDPEALASALRDWIDQDSDVDGINGAEDGEYYRKDTPYRTANNTLTNLGELSLIQGYTQEVIDAISDDVIALPVINNEATKININTANEVLFTTFIRSGLSSEDVTTLFDRLPPPQENPDNENGGNDNEEVVDENPLQIELPQGQQGDIQDLVDEAAENSGHENAKGPRYEGNPDKLKQDIIAIDPDYENEIFDEHFDVKSDYFIVTIKVKIDDVELKEQIVMSRYKNKAAGARNLLSNSGNSRRDIIEYVQVSRIL